MTKYFALTAVVAAAAAVMLGVSGEAFAFGCGWHAPCGFGDAYGGF